MSSVAQRYVSKEAELKLASLLKEIIHVDDMQWHEVQDAVGVSSNVLARFVNKGEALSKTQYFRKVFTYVEHYLREKPESRVHGSQAAEIDYLFGSIGNGVGGEPVTEVDSEPTSNRYTELKRIARLSDDMQERLSNEAAGVYSIVRTHPEIGHLVGHLRISDTYRRHGLPTSQLSRRLVSGPGEMITDGSVWSNNSHIHFVGYNTSTTELHSMQFEPMVKNYTVCIGFISGYEKSNTAFTAKALMFRSGASPRYKDVSEHTGGADSLDKVVEMMQGMGVILNEDTTQYLEYIRTTSYMTL